MTNFLTHKPINDITNTVSSEFGERFPPKTGASSQHKGIDFSILIGTPVYATHSAEVIYKAYSSGWGNFILLRDTVTGAGTLYGHFSEYAKVSDLDGNLKEIQVGDIISGGTQIGLSGNSGVSSGAHLHFELFDSDAVDGIKNKETAKYRSPNKDDLRINPRPYLAQAFPNEFTTTVKSGTYGKSLEGDYRANTLIANSRDNTLEGLAGTDTYEFKSLSNSGSDQIIDSDNDGIIKIAGEEIAGDANPIIDSEKNIIPNQWTIKTEKGKAFQLSKDGTDLVIHQVGSDLSSSQTARIIVANFPFEKSQRSTGTDAPFGISLLGKTPDLTTDANGNVVSETGYDRSTKSLPNLYSFNSNNFFKTADGKGFFGTISYGTLPVLNGGEDNLLSVANFNS